MLGSADRGGRHAVSRRALTSPNSREALMPALPSQSDLSEALPRLLRRLRLTPGTLPEGLVRQLPPILRPLTALPPVRTTASRLLINYYGYATTLRPRALTLAS